MQLVPRPDFGDIQGMIEQTGALLPLSLMFTENQNQTLGEKKTVSLFANFLKI